VLVPPPGRKQQPVWDLWDFENLLAGKILSQRPPGEIPAYSLARERAQERARELRTKCGFTFLSTMLVFLRLIIQPLSGSLRRKLPMPVPPPGRNQQTGSRTSQYPVLIP